MRFLNFLTIYAYNSHVRNYYKCIWWYIGCYARGKRLGILQKSTFHEQDDIECICKFEIAVSPKDTFCTKHKFVKVSGQSSEKLVLQL